MRRAIRMRPTGCEAAIASGLSPLGIGSDVAISVRGPAADTGIASIKSAHGRVPMTGHFPAVPRRWWHAGPMVRSVRDLRLALSLMEGADGFDPYTVVPPAAQPTRGAGRLRIGWTTGAFGTVDQEVAATVAAAATTLADLGHDVQESDFPWLSDRDCTLLSATLFPARGTACPARRHLRPRDGGASGHHGSPGVRRDHGG